MHSNIYSCLFHDANIKEENIIDSNAAWTEVNVVYLTTNKNTQNTFIVCIQSQNLLKDETLC